MINPKEWVAKYGDYLFSIAVLKTNNKETAEDLVQDTFVSAIKAKESFRGDSSEKTWLVSILNNKIIDFYRKKDILRNTDEYITDTEQSFDANFFQSDYYSKAHWKKGMIPGHWKSDADSSINQTEFYKILEACISKMPPKLIPVFVSKFIDDKESDEICKDFNISSSNYWVIIHRAKLLMRSCLEKTGLIQLQLSNEHNI